MRKRLVLLGLCAALACVAVAAGLGVREFTGTFAEHAGTVLYATLMYLSVCLALLACSIVLAYLKVTTTIAVHEHPVTLAVIALVLCWLVEFYQLTGVPARLAAHSTVSRLALGAAFQPLDLFWYVVGAAIAGGLHWTASRLCARRSGGVARMQSGTDLVGPQGVASPLSVEAVTAPPDSRAAR